MAVFAKFEMCLSGRMGLLLGGAFFSQLGYSLNPGRGFVLKLCVGAWALLEYLPWYIL